MRLPFRTVDVFTDRRFGGNQLAVVLDVDGLDDAQMQLIAREFQYSETSFVRSPKDARHTAEVRIFTPKVEVPFAGHPNVGTAYVLATLPRPPDISEGFVFEERAGLVPVQLILGEGQVVGAELTAPEPLTLGDRFDPAAVAGCVGLDPGDMRTDRHVPQSVSIGLPFLVAEVASRAALSRALANPAAVQELLPNEGLDAVYLYTRDVGPTDGDVDFSARMFCPFDGLPEDPATGSATGAAAAFQATLEKSGTDQRRFTVAQGVDMGRRSLLSVTVRLQGGVVNTVKVGGRCVSVMEGWINV